MASPFTKIPENEWIASNAVAFAVYDGFPVSPGHTLVITRRIVETWFDASPDEQAGIMALVNEVKAMLDGMQDPKPDGYNVGFNAGSAAGQTVPHLHVHVIPRYRGDVPDPRGGVRGVIPSKGNYLAPAGSPNSASAALTLSTGHPAEGLWEKIASRLSGAHEADILSAFVQLSGLDILEARLFSALREGASVRMLVGDYLYISSPQALSRMHGWAELAAEQLGHHRFQARLVELQNIPGGPSSFHPKAWRIADEGGGLLVVGSSNISAPALQTGVEWNVLIRTGGSDAIDQSVRSGFQGLWDIATPLTADVVRRYAAAAALARKTSVEPEATDISVQLPSPRRWQVLALERLADIRTRGHRRALVAVATGLGKTWLAAFDLLQAGSKLGRRPRVLVIAHRAEILAQAESVLRRALDNRWPDTRVGWYLGSDSDLSGDLVVASVQKLSRQHSVEELTRQRFDYTVMDEVHHAEAPSYRRVLAYLQSEFTLGLTATPERTDGVDVATLFDDILAWQATIGDGIAEESLVPFHYVGLKDDIDFQQIPWRNGRFDPAVLEERLENSERMAKLWTAWNQHPAARTLVFCCSKRHALYTRQWLRRKGISAAAVFSGAGGDHRSDALRDFEQGKIAALCAVDLFNEGLDVPQVDRVVMLRPTESKIVFIQQLGRGLRAADGKSRLTVIDFVGNHRIFASRIIHLLSLHQSNAGWSHLRKWLNGDPPSLPPGCLLDVTLESKEVLRRLLPTGGSAAIEGYRALRDELGRRPTVVELFHRGYLPNTIRAQHNSWFEFAYAEGDLTAVESETLTQFSSWLRMVETTALNKSFKMVVLQVLLDRGTFWCGESISDLSEACRRYLLSHEALEGDLVANAEVPDHRSAPAKQWAAWWLKWPLDRWLDEQDGRRWFQRTGDLFQFASQCSDTLKESLEAMTRDLVEFRLAQYISTRLAKTPAKSASEFVAKVSHASGKPILFLPSRDDASGIPIGPQDVVLPNGDVWEFRFVKIACNVAHPKGEKDNALPSLLRSMFGPDAGLPGTGYTLRFTQKDGSWSLAPEGAVSSAPVAQPQRCAFKVIDGLLQVPPAGQEYVSFVPVYNLEVAAGAWGPDMEPSEIGWKELRRERLKKGMFIAWVQGHSMEPKIPSGSWCLFQPCPAGSRSGRILLVQFKTMTDPENGGRYTVKKYHSEKQQAEDGWSHQSITLLPTNREYQPIKVTENEAPELLVVGEFVRVVETPAQQKDA